MPALPVIPTRARWADLIEAIHAPESGMVEWSTPITEALRSILPGAEATGFYVVEHSPDFSHVDWAFAIGGTVPQTQAAKSVVAKTDGRALIPFHFTAPVLTMREGARRIQRQDIDLIEIERAAWGYTDGIGLVAHPRPGVVVVLHAIYDSALTLTRRERELLTRATLHLETGYRVRLRPEVVLAEIDSAGNVVDRRDGGPLPEQLIANHARRIGEARRHRSSADTVELWSALMAGNVSLAPRPDGAGYLVLDNPPASRALRAVDSGEAAVLALVARGLTNKLAAYALGVSTATISERLASVAAKLGAVSRVELVRIAAMLGGDPRSELPSAELTAAERDVLELLQRGLSNTEIARHRGRSVRTIANQVAALLRKTNRPSRRALVTAIPA